MSSCHWHTERPAISTIDGKQLCYQCDRRWHDTGSSEPQGRSMTPHSIARWPAMKGEGE